jgi:hypothetical protein
MLIKQAECLDYVKTQRKGFEDACRNQDVELMQNWVDAGWNAATEEVRVIFILLPEF